MLKPEVGKKYKFDLLDMIYECIAVHKEYFVCVNDDFDGGIPRSFKFSEKSENRWTEYEEPKEYWLVVEKNKTDGLVGTIGLFDSEQAANNKQKRYSLNYLDCDYFVIPVKF